MFVDAQAASKLEDLDRRWCLWADRQAVLFERLRRLSLEICDTEARASLVAGHMAEIKARVEQLLGVSFVVERYSEAPAGDEPTPLSFRVKADFGPTH